ncbi:MAG: SusC/RagA family TonB-linked outer membrane protein [Ignavibacteria bacterium]|nr:SusC/RagA family TonB-linked outer membrane protein [Ignavibacteria bacterium]
MKPLLPRILAMSILALTLVLFSTATVLAQEGALRGTVKDAATGEALIGTNVLVVGTNRGGASNMEGAYQITGITPGRYTVAALYIGYKSSQQTVTVTANQTTEVNFRLDQDYLKIDEVVVTGLSGEVPRAQLGNSIAKIGGAEISKIAVTSISDGLAGKVAGLSISKSTGTPGAGTYVQLRGRRTVTGSSTPLWVVDGVPIDDSFIYNGSGTIQGANRATDINPADVESIEVLKGASAAAIYGARAANGVILVTTKSGKATESGKFARINYSSSYSYDEASGSVPQQTTYGQRTPFAPYVPGTTDSYGAKLAAGTPTYEHGKDVFRTGHMAVNSLSISGGSPVLRYLVSGTFTGQTGVSIKSDFNQQNLRLNLNYTPFAGLALKSNSNYITSIVNLPQDGSNTSGILLGSLRAPPEFDNKVFLEADGVTQRRFASYDNPFWTMEFNTYKTELTRFIHSTGFDYDALEGLRFSGNVGWDRYNHFNFQRLAVGAAATTGRLGSIGQDRYTNQVVNTDLMVTGKYSPMEDILATLVAGQQLTFNTRNATSGTSTNTLPFFDQIGAGVTKDAGSSRSENRIYSYYAQLTVNAWDRLSLTGAVRRDAGSTFGDANPVNYYPKASIAYRLSQESFMQSLKGYVDEFKLRVAWGQAGRQPGTYSTNNLYGVGGLPDPWGRGTSAGRSGQSGIIHSLSGGTAEAKPELSTEIETGIDATFWNRRINLEFSYYRQDITQLLLFVDVPRSTGFNSQYRNAGEMWNQGFEVKLDVNPIRWDDFSWVASINYARNRNEVTKLEGFANSYITLTGAFAGTYNIAKEGRRLGTWLGSGYEKDANGKIVYSDPNDPARRDNMLNVGIKNAPRYNGAVELGNADPDWTGSIRNDFTFLNGDLTLSVMFDAVQGQKVWNGTKGAMFNFGTHKATEDREDLWFNAEGQPVLYQGTTATNFALAGGRTYQPGEQLRREVYYRVYGNGFNVNEPFIEDGSFVKLRDVTIAYRWRNVSFLNVESIVFTASGRNLKTWTDYTGYDPEVNTFQQAEGRGFDYFTLPQVRSFRFDISINY